MFRLNQYLLSSMTFTNLLTLTLASSTLASPNLRAPNVPTLGIPSPEQNADERDTDTATADGVDDTSTSEAAEHEGDDRNSSEHHAKSTEASDEKDNSGESTEARSSGDETTIETHNAIGLRTRAVIIPKFMFDLYQVDGGDSVTSWSVGPEFTSGRKGFEYAAWLTYAGYGMDSVPFKAKTDPDVAYELVTSHLKVITLGADFLWSSSLGKGFAVTYGAGAGLGFVFGDLRRVQAYPKSGSPSDPSSYVECSGPGDGPGGYCGHDNDHYGDYTEPSWLDGGSRPVIFPWVALPQIGVRWQPSSSFIMRFDTGLSFPGPFFFGLSGAYGLPN